MKLLLDQNISFRLVRKLESKFPGTEHVSNLGLINKSDKDIWDLAKREDFVIVTFDSDFYDFSLTLGQPPKLIWISKIENNIKEARFSTLQKIVELGLGGQLQLSIKL